MLYNENMSEFIKITFNGDQEFETTPENTVLYTFLGKTALGNIQIENSSINHIYVRLDEEQETNRGMYLFEQFHGDVYKTIAEYVIEHQYPQLLNMRHVPECDLRAHMLHEEREASQFISEIPDFLPENFK